MFSEFSPLDMVLDMVRTGTMRNLPYLFWKTEDSNLSLTETCRFGFLDLTPPGKYLHVLRC